jgi:DNA (cytosine-5)-methyltransferase 1
MGYAQAGFDVTGVDSNPQPNYPFQFVQADALTLDMAFLQSFDAIHASPMCQAHSPLNAYNKKVYPDQIAATRAMMLAAGRPYVIENVVQAPLLSPVVLCGSMFGLRVYRHRGFEASFLITVLPHPRHLQTCARNGYLPKDQQFMTISGGKHSEAWRIRAAAEMGVPWTRTIREVCESIPPAYTHHIGVQLMKRLAGTDRAARSPIYDSVVELFTGGLTQALEIGWPR